MTKHKEKKTNKPGLFKEKFTKMANMQKNEKIKAHLTAFSLNYQISHLRTNWIITDLVGYLVLFFFCIWKIGLCSCLSLQYVRCLCIYVLLSARNFN